jgi:hypothetical protein
MRPRRRFSTFQYRDNEEDSNAKGHQQGAMVTAKDEVRRHDAVMVALAIAVVLGMGGVAYVLLT